MVVALQIEPGFRLGRYEVIEHVATGGMGSVYKAVDRDLGRVVALKLLSSRLDANHVALTRFRREARHAARLNHPNIVSLYEFGHDPERDLFFLAFEFIRGKDLARHIERRGWLQPDEVRRILIQVAKALGHAHEYGIVHRDIKPSNIMLARIDHKVCVKVTDLGLAISKSEEEFRVTREGNTVGTIDYLSPEQARDSQSADTRSDIYSLGCTAYHLLAGNPPFAEGNIGERICKHFEAPPPDVRQFNTAVSAEFWAIIERMLAKKPVDRFASPVELLNALKSMTANATKFAIRNAQRLTEHLATAPTQVHLVVSPDKDPAPAAAVAPIVAAEVSAEQARTAAALYERATAVHSSQTGEDYARQLLESCLKLDPFHLAARKTLRALSQQHAGGVLNRWLGSLSVVAIKSKMRLARSAGDWRAVFETAEQVLAYLPGDMETHVILAETATEHGQPDQAQWFLEQGCEAASNGDDHVRLLRKLARVHEDRNHWKLAIALWQEIAALEPASEEALRMIRDLSAREYLAHHHSRQ